MTKEKEIEEELRREYDLWEKRNPYWDSEEHGEIALAELRCLIKRIYSAGQNSQKEKIKKLKERIKMNGNLSNRIIETEEGEFEHKHDYVLNNIVIDIIEEELTQKIKGDEE